MVFVLLFLLMHLLRVEGFHYVVTTYTGDRFGAGTDARVFIKLFGRNGITKEKELESSGRDNFEKGQLDTFELNTQNVGRVKKAEIRHDNSWLGPGWFLEKVTVTSEDGNYYEFPVHKWFDKHQDDGKTSREIVPVPPHIVLHKKDEIEDEKPRQPLDCSWPQGVGNKNLPDSQISASTSFNDLHLPYHGRLGLIEPNSLGGWCPYKDDTSEYLQFDLGRVKKVSGVATQGMGLVDEWTTAYRLTYSNNSDDGYREYSENGNDVKNFIGNNDQNGTVLHWLRKPFVGQYVRILPLKWHGKGCLRAELYGCPSKNEQVEFENTMQETGPNTGQMHSVNETTMQQHIAEVATSQNDLPGADNQGALMYHHTSDNDPHQSSLDHQEEKFEEGETRSINMPTEDEPEMAIDIIPVAHLDFDEIHDNDIPDVSGHHNDAHFRPPVDVRSFSKTCGQGLRLNGGDVFFDGEFFIDKPREEITLAAWVKLFSNGGQHSIFDTVGGKHSAHQEGQYHFEVDRGRLRWFHRNEAKDNVFNISSPLMIPSHVWTHCAATYSSITGKVAVFVNGKLSSQGYGIGSLSQDWTGRAGIGKHKDQRILNGEIDEFYIFSKVLTPSKVQMLMKRCSFETDCQRPLGMQSKDIKDMQISASSTYNLHKPFYARMNLASFGGDPARTAWCGVKDDKNPYLEVQLPQTTSFTGVATQGLSIFDNWVTTYLFCYSDNRVIWNCYKEKGYDKIFEGNTDKNSVKKHYFHHPVDGKFVRIRPLSWYGNHLCMRVELYGCTMDLLADPYDSFGSLPVFMEDTEAQTRTEISPKEACNNPLGISNGEVDDMRLKASSALDQQNQAYFGRLVRESIDQSDIKGCWCAHDVNLRQFIEADLGEKKTITGIATQGYVAHDNWVASYRLGFSDDATALEWYREDDDEKLFIGNIDRGGIAKHFLKHPIQARYVRINPRAWHGIHICMRFEIFGCKEGPTKVRYFRPEYNDISLRHHTHTYHEIENAEDKHVIPKKTSEKHGKGKLRSSADKLRMQVTSHRAHNVRRLTPGHHGKFDANADDENLQIDYPKPKILRPRLKNLTIPFNPHVKQRPPVRLVLGKNHKPKLQEMNLKTNTKLNVNSPKDMMLALKELQALSEDKVSAKLKEPILELAREKLVEDMKKHQDKKVDPNCKRDLNCAKPNAKSQDMLQLYRQQQMLVPQMPVQSPLINAAEIFYNFPELRQNGITEDMLQSLAARIPNLEEKIYKHFATKTKAEMKARHYNDLALSKVELMKHYNKLMNDRTTTDFMQSLLIHPVTEIADQQHMIEQTINGNQKPCTHSGGCGDFLPESIAYKPPHALPPKPDVPVKNAYHALTGYHDVTKWTPDHLMPSGPDPRFVEYYHQYLLGKPAEPELPPTIRPPPPDPTAPYIEYSVDQVPMEHLPFSLSPAAPIPPPPSPSSLPGHQIEYSVEPLPFSPPSPSPPPLPPPALGAPVMPHIELSTFVEHLPPVSVQASFPTQQLANLPSSVPIVQHEVSMSWTPFSVCSVTCGKGEKKRFRRCSIPDCPSGGVEIETVLCIEANCPDVDPYTWSAYTPCSVTCGVGTSVRYRMCKEENCPVDGYETEQTTCYKPNCPVCVLDFEVIESHEVIDQSGYRNNAFMDQYVYIRDHPQICGHYADLTNMGEILLSSKTFVGKPRTGITIACWLNIQGDVQGKHSIFTTVRETGPSSYIGGYHFEVDGGSVRWFHRDETGTTVFSMMTSKVIMSRIWMHYAVTYDGYKGLARVYVDGKERGSHEGTGLLSADWGYKTSIGYYDFDDRRLNGWIDEFMIYDYALSEDEIFSLLGKMRCPTGNKTTIEIDAFKFENIKLDTSKKRSLIEDDEDFYHKNESFRQSNQTKIPYSSKINAKQRHEFRDNATINTSFANKLVHKKKYVETLSNEDYKRHYKLTHNETEKIKRLNRSKLKGK